MSQHAQRLSGCNCVVKRARITYCPLHAQAPALLSLLRELVQMAEATHTENDCSCADIFTEVRAVLHACEP